MKARLNLIYKKLYSHFGPQNWWPARTPFEVILGAILTQNTNWQNVVIAVNNLRKSGVLSPAKLYRLPKEKLAALIRPSGYYNIKAERIRNFLKFLFANYRGEIKLMFRKKLADLREEILKVKGIGPETADSILLYAGGLPVFVVDAYTKRILLRHRLIRADMPYDAVQNLFMRNLKADARLFNEYHALIVRLGKTYCSKTKPRCNICPLHKNS